MPKALNADRELVKSLFVQGFTPTQISRKTGLNADTISTWSKRGNWTALRSKTCSVLSQPGERLAALTVAENSKRVRESLAKDLGMAADTLNQTPLEPTLDHLGKRADVNQRLAGSAAKVFGWGEKGDAGLWANLDDAQAEIDARPIIDVEWGARGIVD